MEFRLLKKIIYNIPNYSNEKNSELDFKKKFDRKFLSDKNLDFFSVSNTEFEKEEETYKAVRYANIVPLLIEAIKDLKEKVDDLEGRCNCDNNS